MKREGLITKIKDSVKAMSFVFLLLTSFVLMVFKWITPAQWLVYTGGIAPAFWGIREYGKRYRTPYVDYEWGEDTGDHDV